MKTYIQLNRNNLIHNLEVFKKLTGKKIMFVVKANAYGHGLKEVLSITRDLPLVDVYAVDSVEEALMVKSYDPGKPILILGWTDADGLEPLLVNGFETVAPSMDFLKLIDEKAGQLNTRARVQLKVETGTARLGMPPEQVEHVLNDSPFKHLEVTGLYSHFANIEDTTDHSYAQQQLETFNRLLNRVEHKKLLKHFSCSASTILFPKTHFDIVRVGISGYGYWPSKQTYISYIEKHQERLELKPVLSWYSRVAQVKTLETGAHIGYGITYRTFNKTKIAIVPVGYYDGYDRRLSNMSNIIVNGTRAPVRGRVCMTMLMAEVTHIKDIKAGDRITLLGRENRENIDVDDLAEWAGTINYEILARINPMIPRSIAD